MELLGTMRNPSTRHKGKAPLRAQRSNLTRKAWRGAAVAISEIASLLTAPRNDSSHLLCAFVRPEFCLTVLRRSHPLGRGFRL